jgi:hypothetical protein
MVLWEQMAATLFLVLLPQQVAEVEAEKTVEMEHLVALVVVLVEMVLLALAQQVKETMGAQDLILVLTPEVEAGAREVLVLPQLAL